MPHPQAIHMAGISVELPGLKLRLLRLLFYSNRLSSATGIWTTSTSARLAELVWKFEGKEGQHTHAWEKKAHFSSEVAASQNSLFRYLAQIEQFCFALPSAPFAQLIRCRRMTTPSSMHRRRRWGKMPWDGRNEQFAPPGFIVVYVARVWYCCSF